MNNTNQSSDEGFLRLPEVLKLIPVSKSTWWAGVKSGRYPKSIKLSDRITAWRIDDIKQFMEEMSNSSR